MPIPLKSPAEIDAMRAAGSAAWQVLDVLLDACAVGTTTGDLDRLAETTFERLGATGLFRGYRQSRGIPFPAAICVSVNEEVAHGLPGDRTIRDGDVVSIDAGITLGGWCADAARTVVVGAASPRVAQLVQEARHGVDEAISRMRPGAWWSEAAAVIQRRAAAAGLGLVRGLSGHGIGRRLHEPPATAIDVPARAAGSGHSGPARATPGDFVLRPGMVVTVEPILTLGGAEVVELDDGWTVATRDRSLAAQEERTVAVTRHGPVVLTAA